MYSTSCRWLSRYPKLPLNALNKRSKMSEKLIWVYSGYCLSYKSTKLAETNSRTLLKSHILGRLDFDRNKCLLSITYSWSNQGEQSKKVTLKTLYDDIRSKTLILWFRNFLCDYLISWLVMVELFPSHSRFKQFGPVLLIQRKFGTLDQLRQ